MGTTEAPFFAASIVSLVSRHPFAQMFSNAELLRTLGAELLLGVFWAVVLRRRGWSLDCVTTRAAPSDLGHGLGLCLLAYAAAFLASFLAHLLLPGFGHIAAMTRLGGTVSVELALVMCVVNPVVEEFFYLGFVTNVLLDHRVFAISAGMLARALVHTYQGPSGFLSMVAVGAVFGIYYAETRRLWPVVVAHVLNDLMGLLPMVR